MDCSAETFPRIAPSILSADFGRLAEEVRAVDNAGADWIHIDVMDGHFVPNLTLGPTAVAAVRRATRKPLDVHLMITDPHRYIAAFAEAGADGITIHMESSYNVHRALQEIRASGKKAGVSLNPHTTEENLRYVLGMIDLVLVMTVNPGFGGQHYLHEITPKIRAVRDLVEGSGRPIDIEVDGGIDVQTARLACEAGANVLVAGTSIFKSASYETAIQSLRASAQSGKGKPTENPRQ